MHYVEPTIYRGVCLLLLLLFFFFFLLVTLFEHTARAENFRNYELERVHRLCSEVWQNEQQTIVKENTAIYNTLFSVYNIKYNVMEDCRI